MGLARFHRARARLLGPQRAERPLRRHDARKLHQYHGDLVLLLHGDRKARGRADEARRLHDHADLWRLDPRGAALQCHGRGQGGARSVRALSGDGLRAAGHPRERPVAGTDAHAGRRWHFGRARAVQLSEDALAARPHTLARRGWRLPRFISFRTFRPLSPGKSTMWIPVTTSSPCRAPKPSARRAKGWPSSPEMEMDSARTRPAPGRRRRSSYRIERGLRHCEGRARSNPERRRTACFVDRPAADQSRRSRPHYLRTPSASPNGRGDMLAAAEKASLLPWGEGQDEG